MYPSQQQNHDVLAPTIKPVPNFSPQQDCETLRRAMKGLGTDEAALISVLCKRNWQQRSQIEKTYKQMFGKDLEKEISSETSGDFRRVLKRLLKTPVELDAYELHKAIKGLGTDEECLVEVIATKSNAEIHAIKEMYKKMNKHDLEKDVCGDTSGHFRRLVVALLSGSRQENVPVDQALAKADAQALYKAGPAKLGTDESRFNVIFCGRSFPQLRATFDAYQRDYKQQIENVISSEFSGDIKNGLLAIAAIARNKQGYFAQRLLNAMSGGGTKESVLTRIIVSRCDSDLGAIKNEYQRMYTRTLAKDVKVCLFFVQFFCSFKFSHFLFIFSG